MAKAAKKKAKGAKKPKDAKPYVHRGVTAPMRPDVGTQPQVPQEEAAEDVSLRFFAVAGARSPSRYSRRRQ